jgi:hypothetical protein
MSGKTSIKTPLKGVELVNEYGIGDTTISAVYDIENKIVSALSKHCKDVKVLYDETDINDEVTEIDVRCDDKIYVLEVVFENAVIAKISDVRVGGTDE